MKPGSVQFLKRMFVDGECFDVARKTADFLKGMGDESPASESESEPEVVVTTGEPVEHQVEIEHQVVLEPAACSSSSPSCSSSSAPGVTCAAERVGHGLH